MGTLSSVWCSCSSTAPPVAAGGDDASIGHSVCHGARTEGMSELKHMSYHEIRHMWPRQRFYLKMKLLLFMIRTRNSHIAATMTGSLNLKCSRTERDQSDCLHRNETSRDDFEAS